MSKLQVETTFQLVTFYKKTDETFVFWATSCFYLSNQKPLLLYTKSAERKKCNSDIVYYIHLSKNRKQLIIGVSSPLHTNIMKISFQKERINKENNNNKIYQFLSKLKRSGILVLTILLPKCFEQQISVDTNSWHFIFMLNLFSSYL